jgi:predicted amidohydrolase
MRIGHWQRECSPGDVTANIASVLDGLTAASAAGLEMVSFPESFLTGYFRDEGSARKCSLVADGPELRALLGGASAFAGVFMVGFNERRGGRLFNTVLVARAGMVLGTYSKAFPCFSYFTPGRSFPVFEHRGLALKGARLIFAPHYNVIGPPQLINHFQKVRSDHIARARENGVWFLRGNNVCSGRDAGLDIDGVGYGDSYLLDPLGEMVARTQRHIEGLLVADVPLEDHPEYRSRSLASARALLEPLAEAVAQASDRDADTARTRPGA